jgi:hypothetical protein
MWTHISVNCVPVWDLMEYRVVLTWDEGDGNAPVTMVKEGTIDVGTDTTPEAMLQHLVQRLVTEAGAVQFR